jgi:hypothetical protein
MGDEPKVNRTNNPLPQVDLNEVVPRRLRTWMYAAGAVIGLMVWLASEIAVIWAAPEYAEPIMQTANRLLAFTTVLTAGTGTIYRPSSF